MPVMARPVRATRVMTSEDGSKKSQFGFRNLKSVSWAARFCGP